MKNMRICVAGSDGRMEYAAGSLSLLGYEVIKAAAACDIDVLVLPPGGGELPRAVLEQIVAGGGYVIGGMLPVSGARCFDYMKDEAFLFDNARVTAEGAVVLLGQTLKGTIFGADVSIVGMGRIAECLCRMLIPMGAQVTVYARRPEALARARAMGAKTVCFMGELPPCISGHDAICNTVPHVLFGAKLSARIKKETVLIELASRPGGFDMDAVEQYGLQWINGQGLPGKYAPRAAGELIAAYVIGVLEKEGRA